MGREATCTIRWQGRTAEAKVLLEADEVVLRGGIAARIRRADITAVDVVGTELHLNVKGAVLALELGAKTSESWKLALLKPPPTLAQKLGVHPLAPVMVAGTLSDAFLIEAVQGATTDVAENAAILLAEVRTKADLSAAIALAHGAPHLPIWCVGVKGKSVWLSDADIRLALRSDGYVDTKSSAVSALMSATRYNRRK